MILNNGLNEVDSNKIVFFSVVIPAYNCSELITFTLNSLQNQSYKNFEIIVINDGSTDNTAEVINEYINKNANNITVIHQKNMGEGGGRNAGIFAAKGKYIAFLDQDDLWFPWTLQTYYEVINRNDYPSVLIATGKEFSDVFETNKIKYEKTQDIKYDDYISVGSRCYLPAGTPGTIVKTDIAQKVNGLSMDRVIGIDQEFFLKIGTEKGLVHITSPVTVAIRRHSGNLQKNTYMAIQGVFLFIDKEIRQCYPGGIELSWARRSIISRSARTVSIKSLQDGYISDAWKMYCRTFKWQLYLGRVKYIIGFLVLIVIKELEKVNFVILKK